MPQCHILEELSSITPQPPLLCSFQVNRSAKFHSFRVKSIVYKCKNIFTKMLKDVGMEVPESIETRSKFSMYADKGRG